MSLEWRMISGGVTAPKGFLTAGTACGIKPSGKKDVALILSKTPCEAAGAFTRNLAKAAPNRRHRQRLRDDPPEHGNDLVLPDNRLHDLP